MSHLTYIDIADVLLKFHKFYSNPQILHGKLVYIVKDYGPTKLF